MHATLLELRLHVQDEHDWLALDLLLATLAAQGKLGVTEPLLRTKLEKQRHGLGWGHRDALKTLRDLILALEGQCKASTTRPNRLHMGELQAREAAAELAAAIEEAELAASSYEFGLGRTEPRL